MSVIRSMALLGWYANQMNQCKASRERMVSFVEALGAMEMTGHWDYLSLDVGSLEFDQLRVVLAKYEDRGWQVAPKQPTAPERGGLILLLRRQRASAAA